LRVHQCFIQQPGSRCNPLTPALTPDMRPLRPRCLGQLPNSLYEAIFGTQGSSNPPTPRSQSEPDCSSSRVTGVRNANAWCFSGSCGPGRWSPGGGVVATHRIGGVGAPHLAVPAFWLCVRVKRRVNPIRASRSPPPTLPTSRSSARCSYRDARCGTDIPDTVARPPRCHLLVPHVSPPKVPPRLPERYHAEPTPLVMVGRPRLGTLVGERGSAVATRPTGGTLGGGVGDTQPPPSRWRLPRGRECKSE
jgi:hypothetical protein